ncbi:MAG: hypothetical protein WA140_09880 [Geobacteraceae bacterium]
MTDLVGMCAQVQAKATVSATLRTRTNLALHHLFAACRFASQIEQIERENSGQPFGSFWEEILHNSLGVATLTVASMESYANEMYFEGSIIIPSLNPAIAQEIAEIIDTQNILRKYSIALSMRAGKRLDFGVPQVQNADALIKLRNAVVHFRPEWSGEQGKHDKLSKILMHKFAHSALFQGEPMFPRAWASHSFAVWALSTTVEFLEYFYHEAGVEYPLLKFKSQLKELSSNAL